MRKPLDRALLAKIVLDEDMTSAFIEKIKTAFPTPEDMAAEVLRLSKVTALAAQLDTWVYAEDRPLLDRPILDGPMGSIRLDRVQQVVAASRKVLGMESLEDEAARRERETAEHRSTQADHASSIVLPKKR